MAARLLLLPRIMRLTFALLLTACASSSGTSTTKQIDDYVQSLPYLPVDPAQVVMGATSAAQVSGDYSCTTQDLTETRQFDRIIAYAANSESLWPGALVSADSVLTGLFTEVVLPRAPQTISVSLQNIDGTKKATIADPSLSSYRDAVSQILAADVTGSTPANIYSEIEEVHSQQQLDMALGVEASWGLGLASLKTSFDWASTTTRSRYVVRYTQAYYTVDLDAPSSPSAMFDKTVTLDDVTAKMDEQHPPAYVSSVTFGRMVVFTFESTYSSTELAAALDFAYKGGVDVSGDTSVTYKDIISQSKITAFILGGDAGSAVQTIDSYDALIQFIKDGGNYSTTSPGAPIAYKLSYLKDNSPARISLTTDYKLQDCARVSQEVKVTLESIDADTCGIDVYGQATAAATTTATLFDKGGSSSIQIAQGKSFGSSQQPIAESVIQVVPQPGQAITLDAHLWKHDWWWSDDLGETKVQAVFETGWRKDVTVTLTGSGCVTRLVYNLEPI